MCFENYTIATNHYDGAIDMHDNFRKMAMNRVAKMETSIEDLNYKLYTPEEKMAICKGKIATEKDPVKLAKMKSRFQFGIYDFRDL